MKWHPIASAIVLGESVSSQFAQVSKKYPALLVGQKFEESGHREQQHLRIAVV